MFLYHLYSRIPVRLLLLTGFGFFPNLLYSQTQRINQVDGSHVNVIAGKQYKTSGFHQWLWGKHYRKEWATPVQMKMVHLDTLAGGLTPYQKGGGRQSKTLRLWDAQKREYVIRSIDKTFGKALPDIFRHTFIEKIVDDQVSIAHPYSAVTVSQMAEAAGINHTNPQIFFVPKQKALGKYNDDYADQLFLFEQRPDENWADADNFSNSSKIISTEKMFEKMYEENDHRPDQPAYIRARLFDMFIGDWGRHEDQWRWATIDTKDGKKYEAIPRDRDQVYTKFDGVLLKMGVAAAGTGHLKSFDYNISDVNSFNFPARNLDRQAANEGSLELWQSTAKDLQQRLTDAVIESSVKELPPEVFPFSGDEIIAKLKSRRHHLVEYATDYYKFLAKEVDIVGSKKAELFKITAIDDASVRVEAFDLDKNDQPKQDPFYSRLFHANETKEIRIYGLDGHDRYELTGPGKNKILVRLVGGIDKDHYKGNVPGKRTRIYDDSKNDFVAVKNAKLRLSDNPYIHQFKYDAFNYDKKGLGPTIFYSSEDHIYVGLNYKIEKQQWRKFPYGYQQRLNVNYSISEKGFSGGYHGSFIEAIGKWNLNLDFNYDDVRWMNYYGLGNESVLTTKIRDFHRMRTKNMVGSVGVNRLFAFYHKINLSAFYNGIDIRNDAGRFLATHPPLKTKALYEWTHFAGLDAGYAFTKLNNPLLPTKGIEYVADVSHSINVNETDSALTSFSSSVNFYLPLSKSFTLRLRGGGATYTGHPEFYQMSLLGGNQSLRGYRRTRFYGKTMAFSQNELQFVRPVRSHLFNGKAGLLGLYDIGRVWLPGENSDTWHSGYGGGIILSPFNKFTLMVTYGTSKEDHDFGVRFYKSL